MNFRQHVLKFRQIQAKNNGLEGKKIKFFLFKIKNKKKIINSFQ